MSVDNTAAGLAVLAACTADIKQWYLQNGLQLNPDKSEALVVGTANQLCVVGSSVSSVSVAGVDLPVAEDMKVLGVVLNRRLTFHRHVSIVARSCNYHAQAIRHIRHLLTTELAQTTLPCSLILSWLTTNYSRKHIVRTIEQRAYDLRRRYDTTYSQNVSQTTIVS